MGRTTGGAAGGGAGDDERVLTDSPRGRIDSGRVRGAAGLPGSERGGGTGDEDSVLVGEPGGLPGSGRGAVISSILASSGIGVITSGGGVFTAGSGVLESARSSRGGPGIGTWSGLRRSVTVSTA
jgi:hypothetical protein